MVVCIEPDLGFFLRINTKNYQKPCVPIIKIPDHPFLSWDSHIECNILDLDEYIIDEAIGASGVIGIVTASLCEAILKEIDSLPYISSVDKTAIHAVLDPLVP